MKTGKKLLALLLAVWMLMIPAFAVAENDILKTAVAAPQPSDWAVTELLEAEILNMAGSADYIYYLHDAVTEEAVDRILSVVRTKLGLLGSDWTPPAEDLPFDNSRQGVINALYQEAAAYQLLGLDSDPVQAMAALGVLRGDGTGYALERECTLQEALVMGQRLVLAVYDACDSGSLGLLWKATGNGNTMYLLGTIHLDRGNVYPFHNNLREAMAESDVIIFEVDFGDLEGYMEYVALMTYSDGTTLKDHVSAEAYDIVIEIAALIGMTEEETAQYKPWVLASLFQSLMTVDESSGDTPVAIDLYVYYVSLLAGKEIEQVESYVFQGELFDSLSPEYQEEYMVFEALLFYESVIEGTVYVDSYDAMLNPWKDRDVEGFESAYDKEAVLDSDDELGVKLFIERDANMIKAADEYLRTGEGVTYMLVVGAGHMVGEGGIIQGLIDLGYEVELVPVA